MNAWFMTHERQENAAADEFARIKHYGEFHTALEPFARESQASRCLDCGVPYCQSRFGCPLCNLIPEWNALLADGHVRAAYDRLARTSCFPEFTGRVCPALCEKACNLSVDGAVTNRDNELYIIETAFANGWVKPRLPKRYTGRHVAVIGSGPSGLAAADSLRSMGHEVTVYERSDAPGGLMMYGIPSMKLDKAVVRRRVSLMEKAGVKFVLNADADKSVAESHDAVALCCGAGQPRDIGVSGAVYAVDYLTEVTRAVLEKRRPRIGASGKSVIVVGGGDTGNDCVATCIRQGCARVTQLEVMPRPPLTRAQNNPWPEIPRVLDTGYGQEEAAAVQGGDPRVYETTVKAFDGQSALLAKMRREGSGFCEVRGGEHTMKCDLLITAAGFTGCERAAAERFGAKPDARGNLEARIGENVFSAGDAHTGQSLVAKAIADGLRAARDINEYLARNR